MALEHVGHIELPPHTRPGGFDRRRGPSAQRTYLIIEVFETDRLRRRETVQTEHGAHTLAFDAGSNTVYAFLPESHRAAVYVDRE